MSDAESRNVIRHAFAWTEIPDGFACLEWEFSGDEHWHSVRALQAIGSDWIVNPKLAVDGDGVVPFLFHVSHIEGKKLTSYGLALDDALRAALCVKEISPRWPPADRRARGRLLRDLASEIAKAEGRAAPTAVCENI